MIDFASRGRPLPVPIASLPKWSGVFLFLSFFFGTAMLSFRPKKQKRKKERVKQFAYSLDINASLSSQRWNGTEHKVQVPPLPALLRTIQSRGWSGKRKKGCQTWEEFAGLEYTIGPSRKERKGEGEKKRQLKKCIAQMYMFTNASRSGSLMTLSLGCCIQGGSGCLF